MQLDSNWSLGSVVPSHYQGGIVAASFFASLSGCLLTVEILHRRATALGNLRSWLETLGCATSMGLVGIWSMHFIGNRAIVLGDGSPEIQLVYSPGFTTLSVFLPIIGLTIAFAASEISTRSSLLHWALSLWTGVFAGLSIVGMHYIGNLGISNYTLDYAPRFFAASIIISVGDCIMVLMLFYAGREKWITAWWKRLACALTLAGGVTAMHFTASTNCTYTLRAYSTRGTIGNRDVQVLVAGVLCGIAAVLTLLVLVIIKHRNAQLKRRSQKIMLACAVFDPDGRIMVTTQGVLPAREITDRYHHRAFDEDFDVAHPVFQWILRVSYNWRVVADIIPKMKTHLNAHAGLLDDSDTFSTLTSNVEYDPQTYNDCSVIFRERFCIAAASLAASMQVGLSDVGLIYDKIIETGTLAADQKPSHNVNDLEKNPMAPRPFGKGQLLFLTRQLKQEAVDKLLNAGFRFASIQHVGRNIAAAMQIPISTLDTHITGLERYITLSLSEPVSETRLGCFVMIPKLGRKGFDVVVKLDDHSRLPDIKLLSGPPTQWQMNFLNRLNGMRSSACLDFLYDRHQTDLRRTPSEVQLAGTIAPAIHELGQQVPSAWFEEALFYAQPLHMRYDKSDNPKTILFTFIGIADIHTATVKHNHVTRLPLTFFNTMQRCVNNFRDQSLLARDIHHEFGPILARRSIKEPTRIASAGWWMRILGTIPEKPRLSRRKQFRQGYVVDEVEQEMEAPRPSTTTSTEPRAFPTSFDSYGGILVDSETVIATDNKAESTYSRPMDALHLGTDVAVGTSKAEDTYVDRLVRVVRGRFSVRETG